MMSDLGVQVTVLEALPKLLPGCDADVVDVVARSFKKRGIDVRTGVKVTGHEPGDGQHHRALRRRRVGHGRRGRHVGRPPARCPTASASTAPGSRSTSGASSRSTSACAPARTACTPSATWSPRPQLAHVGFAEAIVAIKDILGEDAVPVDYGKVPWCIYCHPEVAFAGLSEQAAKEAGLDVVVSKHRFSRNSRALIIGETEGLVKVIAEKGADGKAGRILGVHMVGPVGDRAARPGLPGGELGGHARRGRPLHPAAPDAVRDVRRDGLALTGRGLHG